VDEVAVLLRAPGDDGSGLTQAQPIQSVCDGCEPDLLAADEGEARSAQLPEMETCPAAAFITLSEKRSGLASFQPPRNSFS
jgi:hypothetical protein